MPASGDVLLDTSVVISYFGPDLAKAGTPIPENDIWIVALALEHQLPLTARDAHFDRISGLQVLKW
jgi:tRNA(fMet)-specific endonuclease VapC